MKRHEALPSRYLSKEDFPKPALCQIAQVVIEEIESQERGKERRPVLYVLGNTKGLILNGTNWDALEVLTGADDSDLWEGHQIVIFTDPTVTMMGKRVGGVRIRAPKAAAPAAAPVAPAAPVAAEEPPPLSDDDVPF